MLDFKIVFFKFQRLVLNIHEKSSIASYWDKINIEIQLLHLWDIRQSIVGNLVLFVNPVIVLPHMINI